MIVNLNKIHKNCIKSSHKFQKKITIKKVLTVLNNDVNIEHVADKNATKNESFFGDDLSIFHLEMNEKKDGKKSKKLVDNLSKRC